MAVKEFSINRGKKPKMGQKLLSSNLTFYTVVLMHRQYGKTDCIANIILSYLLSKEIFNPVAILYCSTLSQVRKYYLKPHLMPLKDVLGATFDGTENTYSWVKNIDENKLKEFSTIYLGGANEKSTSNRGGTGHILCGDEFGDWSPHYAQTVFNPMGHIHNAFKIYSGTPRGPNHFKDFFFKAQAEMNKGNKDYYALKWDINQSLKHGEVSQKEYDRLRLENSGKMDWVWKTEWLLDFDASTPGRVFAPYVERAKEEDKIGLYPPEPGRPCETVWDLGVNGTICLFRQKIGGKHLYFKCFREVEECNFQNLIQKKVMPYIYMNGLKMQQHIFPHDIKNRELMSEKPRFQVAQELLGGNCVALKAFRRKDEAIDKACRTWHRCYFDEEGCYEFLRDLTLVRYEDGDFIKTGDDKVYTHSADTFVLGENYGESVSGVNLFYDEKGFDITTKSGMRQAYEDWCRRERADGNDPFTADTDRFKNFVNFGV